MRIARRLYVYLLSGIGLAVLVSGLSLLLTTLLERLGVGDARVVVGEQALRERLTLATAMTAVSLPVWLIHWFVAERGVRGDEPDAVAERTSTIRGLYFTLVLGGLLIGAVTAAQQVVETAILVPVGESSAENLANNLAILVVTSVAWTYHARTWLRDWRAFPALHGRAFHPRTYLYLASFVALFGFLLAVIEIIDLIGLLVTEPSRSVVESGPRWWVMPMASATAQAIVFALPWIGHWWYVSRMANDPGPRGAVERPAGMRYAYFTAVIVLSAAFVIWQLGYAATLLIQAGLGVSEAADGLELGTDVVVALAIAIVFAVAAYLHTAGMRASAATVDGAPLVAERLIRYPLALLGVAYAGIGVARLIGFAIQVLFSSSVVVAGDELWRSGVAEFLPLAILGIATWIWHWTRIGRSYADAPAWEAESAIRRTGLLLALAAGILAGISALGVILYRLFGSLFGLQLTGDMASELSAPIGSLLVAVTVATYHGLTVRGDGRWRVVDEDGGAEPQAGLTIPVLLVGPGGASEAQQQAAIDAAASSLPEGWGIRRDRD